MKKESFYVKSGCDGQKIFVTLFEPQKDIKGIVQLSHGMVEHQIYYYELMEYLCKLGYVCLINDHRGHGKSVINEKDLGYFGDEKAEYIVEDLHQLTMYLKKRYKNKPIYLFGHSMGSLVVRKYLKKYDKDIDKLIVCGSPSINSFSKIGLWLSKTMKLIRGPYFRSKLLNSLALSSDKSNSWLSVNEKYISDYNNDVLCGYIFTTNGFINLMNLMVDVYSPKNWILSNKSLPILFIAGKNDIVIKSEKKWLKSIEFLKNIGYKNISFKLYSGYKHVIFKDNLNKICNDIVSFIEES